MIAKMRRTNGVKARANGNNGKSRVNGNYRVRGGFDNSSLAIVPESSPELFERLYDRDLERIARVLVYIDSGRVNAQNGFEVNLASGFRMYGDGYFQVGISTNEDTTPVEYADIVLNGFWYPSEKFAEKLKKYDDASRLVLDVSEVWQDMGGSANEKSVRDYVLGIKELLQKSSRTLEEAVA